MSLTKQRILDSAMRFFLEKGYLATSIQNIADDCCVAKGSVYNFFNSKEDLLIEVLMLQHWKMSEQIQHIRADQTRSLRDVFIRETECQIEFILNNNFIMQEIKNLTVPHGKIAPYLFRLRANMLKYNKESIVRVFGEGIESSVWDLVIMYNGILREFIFLLIFENKSLIPRDIAVFVVQSIEDMATSIQANKRIPLLQDSDMTEYLQCALKGESVPTITRIIVLIESLDSTIKELSITNSEKKELQEATHLLQEEIESEHPKVVLIRALIAFLEKEHSLKDILRHLEKLVINNL